MVALAIVGILSAIAIVTYRQYADRARAAEILVQYDAARTRMSTTLAQGGAGKCNDLAGQAGAAIDTLIARLSIAMAAVQGDPASGWRPVLVVCARADRHGSQGVEAAREAFKILSRENQVEPGAEIRNDVVRFALPLTAGGGPQCVVPLSSTPDPCADPAAAPATGTPAPPAPAPAPSAGPAPASAPTAAPESTPESTPSPTPVPPPALPPTPAPAAAPSPTPSPQAPLPTNLGAPPGAARATPAEGPAPSPPRTQGDGSQLIIKPSQPMQPAARPKADPTCPGGQAPGPADTGCVCPSATQWQADACVPLP